MTETERREELVKLVCGLLVRPTVTKPGENADVVVDIAVKLQAAIDRYCEGKPALANKKPLRKAKRPTVNFVKI